MPGPAGLAALGGRLPQDVQQDAAHVFQQFLHLSFTQGELSGAAGAAVALRCWLSHQPACPARRSALLAPPPLACLPPAETEEVELERVQHHNSTTPRKAAAPPAAPPDQYASPGAALASGAMAASVLAAARARAPAPLPSAADVQQQVEQRQALAQAAAVAHEAAVGVLPEGEGEGEGPEGPPGEDDSLMQQEIEEEVAEAAAAAAAPVVLTPAGEIALAPEAPAKGAGARAAAGSACSGRRRGECMPACVNAGLITRSLPPRPAAPAVPSRGATPLPPDPFEMVGGADEAQLASNTIHELRVGGWVGATRLAARLPAWGAAQGSRTGRCRGAAALWPAKCPNAPSCLAATATAALALLRTAPFRPLPLQGFRREQGDLAVADEAVRQLEATNDLEALSLQEQQAREASGAAEVRGCRPLARRAVLGPAALPGHLCWLASRGVIRPRPPALPPLLQKLAALRQLQEYEAAMEEGEAAEAAVQGDAAPAPPLHKSRSQQAAAVLESNLAGLASEWGGSSSMEGPTAASPKDAVPAAPEPAGEAA